MARHSMPAHWRFKSVARTIVWKAALMTVDRARPPSAMNQTSVRLQAKLRPAAMTATRRGVRIFSIA